jgi:hypothetical protein
LQEPHSHVLAPRCDRDEDHVPDTGDEFEFQDRRDATIEHQYRLPENPRVNAETTKKVAPGGEPPNLASIFASPCLAQAFASLVRHLNFHFRHKTRCGESLYSDCDTQRPTVAIVAPVVEFRGSGSASAWPRAIVARIHRTSVPIRFGHQPPLAFLFNAACSRDSIVLPICSNTAVLDSHRTVVGLRIYAVWTGVYYRGPMSYLVGASSVLISKPSRTPGCQTQWTPWCNTQWTP